MTLEKYVSNTLASFKLAPNMDVGAFEVEFDIGLDSFGEVDQASQNRVKFTVKVEVT